MVATQNSTKVVTGKVRLSYAHLNEPYAAQPDQEPRYSCVLVIPKSDKATIAKLRKAQQAALENSKAKLFGGRIPSNWNDTLHDGDEEGDLERNPEYKDSLFVSVWSKQKPGIVDRNRNAILDSSEIYSGCYARVSLNAYAYSNSGNKGVSFGLGNLQKLADGEALDGRTKAEDDFDVVEDEDDADSLI